MSEPVILNVAVDVPLCRLFDYLPPVHGPVPPVGARVRVPFGRRRETGLVLAHASVSEVPAARLRRAESIDGEALLNGHDLWLQRFVSDYYHHPIGEVVSAALPAALRHGKALHPTIEIVAATDAAATVDVESLSRRAPRQAELLEILLDAGGGGCEADLLFELMPNWRRAASGLIDKGFIDRHQRQAADIDDDLGAKTVPGPALNAAQQAAVSRLAESDGFAAYLLDGVTGSGKTEVYLQRILKVIDSGRQVLVLVPEIGLTPQLTSRLRERLGIDPALYHSGLSDTARLTTWRAARNGAARLIVGTRSAVFVPLTNPGLIVVDEEHDASLKQQEGLRYSARDLAVARAKHLDIPVVLGSATPSLELLQHCRSGSFKHLELPARAGASRDPVIRLIDTVHVPCIDGISEPLAQSVDKHLHAGGQALLFLNRRGFAPALICASCNHIAGCSRCDSRLTVHAKAGELRCHHCGSVRPLSESCDQCGESVRPLGEGTERIEDVLRVRFPDRKIRRIDSDSVRNKTDMDAALSDATEGHADILVGTQMLSKGHHFPKLTLVGIVNPDQGLFGTDFRSAERMAQSIVQVAGRAGRERRRGEVLIQTAFAGHPFWRTLQDGGYRKFADAALAERESTRWPPFCWLALIRSAAHQKADAHQFLTTIREHLQGNTQSTRILGPVDAPMARRAGRYHAQLLLQSDDRAELHRCLSLMRHSLDGHPAARKVRWSIDVDPIELF